MGIMKRYLKSRFDRLFASFAKKEDIDNLFIQLSCLLEIREIAGASLPLGPFSGWALFPDTLLTVLRDVRTRVNPRVIEFGSGESTIAIAAGLKAAKSGLLTTIEHDSDFADRVLKRLRQCNLADCVDLKVVPLRAYDPRWGFSGFTSYDLAGLDSDFDVAIIDGPIVSKFGAATRSIPLEWCAARLAGERVIYLDDALRAGEQSICKSLKARWPTVNIEYLVAEKGLAKITCDARVLADLR